MPITQKDILRISEKSGLMSCMFEISSRFRQQELESFCDDVVDLVNSGRLNLFSEVDEDYLNQISGPTYFRGMRLVCEVIPSCKVNHQKVLRLVQTLVLRAGEDMAAITAFTALKNWCEKHPQEARVLVEDAECLRDKALNYISFVFEGLKDCSFVLRSFKETTNPKLQLEAAIALGRMTLYDTHASEAIEILSETAVSSSSFCVSSNSLLTCYAILEKHHQISRELPLKGLESMINSESKEASNVLVSLLWMHGRNLTEDEWALIATNLKSVTIDKPEILQKIDHCAYSATKEHAFFELTNLIRHLIASAQGQLTIDDFALFQRMLIDADISRLSKVVVQWLMNGNFHVCGALEQAFSSGVSNTIELELNAADLPTVWHEQLFLCRKAVGWFCSRAITAASVLIAALLYGHDEIKPQVCAMLEYPLLLNYNEEVHQYLNAKMEQHQDALITWLEPVLNRTKRLFESLQLVDFLPELQPSETKQYLRSAIDHEQFRIGWRSVESKSILNTIVPLKHFIYGNTWATYVRDANDEYVLRSQRPKTHTVRVSYPQLNSLDQARLNRLLLIFRNEQRVEQ